MIRVLWVFDVLSPQHRRLAVELARSRGISLEVMCRWSEQPPLTSASIPLTPLVCRHKLDFAAREAIRGKLRTGAFDLVHAYTSRNLANVVGACRSLAPRPGIIGYRGTIHRLDKLDPANWITFLHPRVSLVVCVSHAARQALLRSGRPPEKLATVWEGCDPEILGSPPRSALAEFDIPPDAFVVGVVANMRPVKGIDLLLEAALQLADLRDTYWLLIGEVRDPRISRLAADARIADRVRLAGPRVEGGRFAGLFDLYAAPSRMEGLSMSVMEAMALGTCPVVSDAGGLPELVRHGIDGLVVPGEDVGALACAIRRLHDEPALRRRLAESARERMRHDFSVAAWAERLLAVYHQLARAGPGSTG